MIFEDMKKALLALLCSFVILTLMSNEGGRANESGPATGAPGESGETCSNFGCHSSGSFNPELGLRLIDSTGTEVGSYRPGNMYTVALNINHTGLPRGYGFQMVCLDHDTLPINNFFDLPLGISEVTLLERQYVEQNRRLPVDSIPLSWMAPESDTVTFYAIGNAVNGNGNPNGDGIASGQFKFARDRSSMVNDLAHSDFRIYPNPVSDLLQVHSKKIISSLQILDFNGRILKRIIARTSINISDLNSGVYLLGVENEKGQMTIRRFLKN